MTTLALDLAVAIVCGCALLGLKMWLGFKREKFTHEPIANIEELVKSNERRCTHLEAKLSMLAQQPRRVG